MKFISNLDSDNKNMLYKNINDILTNKDHPIGDINHNYVHLYSHYKDPLMIMKYHVHHVTLLIFTVY